jgi:hypothetical protein
VATRAILAELPAVLILMAACTFARQSEVGSLEVFDEDSAPGRGRNVFCLVTIGASDAGMLSCECKAGLSVVQGLAAWFPVNQLEIGAVVLRMALRTIFAGGIRVCPHGMHAAPLGYPFADFRVAFKTL